MPGLTLQPDAADGLDVLIQGVVTQTYNFGTLIALGMGEGSSSRVLRSLIKFNLTNLPAAATLTSTILSLYCYADVSTTGRTFRIYRTKRAWVEGTRAGAEDNPATGATWARYDTTHNWSTAGGFHADDCEQTDIGSRNFTATETLNEFKDFPLTPTTKAALDLGNGWMGKADTESADAYYFYSSDHATASLRPLLTVEFTLPAKGEAAFNRTFSQSFRGAFG